MVPPPTPMSSLLLLLLLAGGIGGEADPSSYPISSSSSSSDEGGVEDWTAGCPSVCRCKWVSGKRTAECQDRGLTRLPDFGKPDRIQVGILRRGRPIALAGLNSIIN